MYPSVRLCVRFFNYSQTVSSNFKFNSINLINSTSSPWNVRQAAKINCNCAMALPLRNAGWKILVYTIKYEVRLFFSYSQTVNSGDLKLTEHCLKKFTRLTLLFFTAIFKFHFNNQVSGQRHCNWNFEKWTLLLLCFHTLNISMIT